MREEERFFDADDGARIFIRIWKPDGASRAVVQILHGMAEHSFRYRRLAEHLCAVGIEVWADDHRGHGKTATDGGNDPARGGLLGHCHDRDGFFRVVRDCEAISGEIGRTNPGLPIFLLGHSWGSFLAQAIIERNSDLYRACILSGTRGRGGPEVKLGHLLAQAIAFAFGSRRHSKLLFGLSDGAYNQQFKPNRTRFDWLSRDAVEVDRYVADPLCGFPCSSGFYRDLFGALAGMHTRAALSRIRKDLSVYVFSGAEDPVGLNGESVTDLVKDYRAIGIEDLEFVLYPQGRHETLNDTNRDEVMTALIAYIKRRIQAPA